MGAGHRQAVSINPDFTDSWLAPRLRSQFFTLQSARWPIVLSDLFEAARRGSNALVAVPLALPPSSESTQQEITI